MNILQLIQLLVALLGKAMPVPDLKDVAAVEKWLAGMNGPTANIITLIATQLDNRVGDGPLPSDDEIRELVGECCGDVPELDPATIIAIVTAIIKLIQMWRNRRAPTPEPTPDVI